jgi:hypothetical protein
MSRFLAPPAWGLASFSVPAAAPKGLLSGEKVKVHATLLVDDGVTTQKRLVILRQAGTDTTFSVTLDGSTVHSDELGATSAGDSIDILSTASSVSSDPTINMAVQAGEIPVHLKVYDVSLVPETSSGTSPGDPGDNDDKGGDDDSGNGDDDSDGKDDNDGKNGDDSSTSPSSTPTGGQDDVGDMAGSIHPGSKQAIYAIAFLVVMFSFII